MGAEFETVKDILMAEISNPANMFDRIYKSQTRVHILNTMSADNPATGTPAGLLLVINGANNQCRKTGIQYFPR